MQTGRCIIVAAGDRTISEIPVAGEDLLIAVDGGLDYCRLLGLEPELVVGDCDSVSEELLAQLDQWEEQRPGRVIRLKPEKDDTDTLAAIRLALERGYRFFQIYGATGGRLEHTIANIQCLLFLKHHGAAGYLMDGLGMIFVMENEEVGFPESMEGYLSLFSLGREAQGVDIQGMKYELENARIANDFPIGISNEFIGKRACVRVRDGQLLGIIAAAVRPAVCPRQ